MDPVFKSSARAGSGAGNRDAVKFDCPSCKSAMHVGVSRLRAGTKVQCGSCEDEHTLTADDIPRLLAGHRKRLQLPNQKK